ncbi:MAG: hypothetical protein DRH90_21980 [Deltaproteobacteria bacterium]|nr:MAG: hypothetical protein DRH90_21980 [Deltaproteobacteria bacterium]
MNKKFNHINKEINDEFLSLYEKLSSLTTTAVGSTKVVGTPSGPSVTPSRPPLPHSPSHTPGSSDELSGYMVWRNEWIDGTEYKKDRVVRDSIWTMVSNKKTSDRPAPQNIGAEALIYQGTSPTSPVTAKSISSGIRVSAGTTGFSLNGYDAYVVSGNYYRIFLVLQNGQIEELQNFTANTTGWASFTLIPRLILPGLSFAIVQTVNEPDPTPTVWTGDWDYQTPNNAGTPASGAISHANRQLDQLRIHKTDDNGGNRSAELLALNNGDIVDGMGMRWAISDVTDSGTYVTLSVAPASQGTGGGVNTFTFETVSATPITVVVDTNWWGLNQPSTGVIKGLYSIDEAPWAEVDDAYGINLTLQEVYVSADWDLLSRIG